MKNPILILLLALSLFTASTMAVDCAGAALAALSSEKAGGMIMGTGKALNDLGDYDLCKTTEGLKYGAFSLFVVGGLGKMFIGACLPVECHADELDIISQAIVKASDGLIGSAYFYFAEETTPKMTGWRVFGIIFFTLLAAVCVFGVVVEYTGIFDKYRPDPENPPKDVVEHKTVLGKAFVAFSPARNMRKLFYSPFNDKDNLKVLNGVRVLSMLYVVLGHAYFNVLIMPTSNTYWIPQIVQPLWFQVIPGGFFAVDVFFYLSGFLGAYLMINKFYGKKSMNFAMIYFHRFYRLAPTVFLLIMFAMTFVTLMGDGPVWSQISDYWIAECPQYWWSYVLFINSIHPGNTAACVGWLWYLSHDMIFFITLPFQVFLYIRKRWLGYSFSYFLLIANLVLVMSLTIYHKIAVSILVDPNYGEYIYFKPWSRLGAYQVGVITGMMYYEYIKGDKPEGDKSKIGYKAFKSISISPTLRWVCYVTGFVMIVGTVFIITPETRLMGATDDEGHPKRYYPLAFGAIYNALCRPVYVFGLGLILAGPLTGKGSFLQVFLGSRFWAPWAKLSFFAYMIHLFVFSFFFAQMRNSLYLNHKTILWSYFGVITLTLILAIPFSMFLEVPLMQLERLIIFPPRKKSKHSEDKSIDMKINNSELGTSHNDTTDSMLKESTNSMIKNEK